MAAAAAMEAIAVKMGGAWVCVFVERVVESQEAVWLSCEAVE